MVAHCNMYIVAHTVHIFMPVEAKPPTSIEGTVWVPALLQEFISRAQRCVCARLIQPKYFASYKRTLTSSHTHTHTHSPALHHISAHDMHAHTHAHAHHAAPSHSFHCFSEQWTSIAPPGAVQCWPVTVLRVLVIRNFGSNSSGSNSSSSNTKHCLGPIGLFLW